MLNGVALDLLSAGCYAPTDPMADADGNVQIGCTPADGWLLDPLGPGNGFGTDLHHAHTQPDGTYHYHGDPEALFDDSPGPNGSPVIGFAADGFPIYGSYFHDGTTVRKAISGYTLKAGNRPGGADAPSGAYDGQYIDDYEFTGAGDLDACKRHDGRRPVRLLRDRHLSLGDELPLGHAGRVVHEVAAAGATGRPAAACSSPVIRFCSATASWCVRSASAPAARPSSSAMRGIRP